MGLSFSMIKILAFINNEKILITIDDNDVLLVNSEHDVINKIIKSAYADARKSYGPECGFFGGYLAMELDKYGVKILKVSDTEEDEAEENRVW